MQIEYYSAVALHDPKLFCLSSQSAAEEDVDELLYETVLLFELLLFLWSLFTDDEVEVAELVDDGDEADSSVFNIIFLGFFDITSLNVFPTDCSLHNILLTWWLSILVQSKLFIYLNKHQNNMIWLWLFIFKTNEKLYFVYFWMWF